MTREDIPNQYAVPEVENLLEEAIEILAEARPSPMSATVKVNRDELLHLLEQAQERLPEELRAARWLLKEREDFIDAARQEHRDLIDQGRAQVSRMVERQEVVKAAEARARQIILTARKQSNTTRRQTEEYCDKKLANFEMVLGRTASTVRKGRERLMSSSTDLGPIDDDSRQIDLTNGDGFDVTNHGLQSRSASRDDHDDYEDDDFEEDEEDFDDYDAEYN